MTTGHVLVVDDEPDIRRLIQEILEDENFTVSTAENAEQARQSFKQGNIDLVLLDIWMPDTDGISLLKEWSDNGGLTTPVIMMSGHGNIETAVEATRLGAYDFIEKPVSMGKLMITVERAMESRKLLEENIRLKQHLEDTVDFIGKSTVIEKLRQEAEQVASHDTPVLLTGEAGSGNSAIARLIHQNSMRKQDPFIEISPTASSEDAAVKIFGSE
ncbi:MAG TPA: sigma-54-dependent Fis family transcriptional regulator, partial [Acidiferrobacteraceae bacterium]|nr:sigma-54-dependent Fis family transcriptional regulator [Acidiferrobacteraceae bacterium]HEX20332.1 sigma-54-dependent Fis family transcriptional regulator [Acidiferrobacteraceae bacterium]